MVTVLVLQLPDFTLPFEIECDASSTGIGVVLMQHRHPIAHFSKTLFDRNLAKLAYEREIMVLALAVQHWCPYLLGKKFTVFSYQRSHGFLLHQQITTPTQKTWVAKLLGYTFNIIYKQGKENGRYLQFLDIFSNLGRRLSTGAGGKSRPQTTKNYSCLAQKPVVPTWFQCTK